MRIKRKILKESKGISISNNQKTATAGITLIALVITIIVLLILAGVSIATLTGENGILTQAEEAKNKTTEAESIERVKVEVAGSYGTDGKVDLDQLNDNLRKNVKGLTYNGAEISEDDSNRIASLPATVTLNGYDIEIKGNGSVDKKEPLKKVADVKNNETVFEDNETIEDTYGNTITIPAGFKIASDSATDVTGGIVIEDATYTNTIGSQFVWIPVGDVKTATGTKPITLGRYDFDSTTGEPSAYSGDYVEENSKDTENLLNYGNTIAEDIEEFKDSANNNNGYYIGRYEARKSSAENLTVVGTDSVYNSITQPNAATASRDMYDEDLTFTSDLMNSYAWDTTIVFEQTFDNRTTDKTKPYSRQNSLNTTLATTGTNNLTDTTKQDKICNIWDMASNCWEWTTETYSYSDDPCGNRGGIYYNSRGYTSCHGYGHTSYSDGGGSFRPLLYL